jgi:hypothetical protein
VGHFVADEYFELLLFRGLVGLHIKTISAPCFTTLHTSVVPRFTPHLASVVPRLATLLATSASRLAPCHTGRCWCAWCWSA